MRLKIARWGNSLAVRLPREIVERFRLEAGQAIDADIDRRGVILNAPAVPNIPPAEALPDPIGDWPDYDWEDVDPMTLGKPIDHASR